MERSRNLDSLAHEIEFAITSSWHSWRMLEREFTAYRCREDRMDAKEISMPVKPLNSEWWRDEENCSATKTTPCVSRVRFLNGERDALRETIGTRNNRYCTCFQREIRGIWILVWIFMRLALLRPVFPNHFCFIFQFSKIFVLIELINQIFRKIA